MSEHPGHEFAPQSYPNRRVPNFTLDAPSIVITDLNNMDRARQPND